MGDSAAADQVVFWPRRHAYALLVTGMLATFLGMFVMVEWLRVPLLADPGAAYLNNRSWLVALLGLALLVFDVVLPVPSSGVMIAHGSVFGLLAGSALSLVGGAGATAAGYLVGWRSQRIVERLVSPEQQERAAGFLERHGVWAIVATRPVPMVAETVAILAGISRIPLRKVVLAGALGNLVPAVAYAAVGAYAATFVSGLFVFTAVLILGGAVWVIQHLAGTTAFTPTDREGELAQ